MKSKSSGLSCGAKPASGEQFVIEKERNDDYIIALAGNPNVGKSTVFNALTGLHQHTGNWPGKTVTNAQGRYEFQGHGYVLVDLPGTYSLMAHSAEEEVARDFICFGGADVTVVVCDATCLERNLNLVLQTLEITPYTIVCVNLLDEAYKKGIMVDLTALSAMLGVPAIGTSARDGKGLNELMAEIALLCTGKQMQPVSPLYDEPIEYGIELLQEPLREALNGRDVNTRFAALKLLEGDLEQLNGMEKQLGIALREEPAIKKMLDHAMAHLLLAGYDAINLKDSIVTQLYKQAEWIAAEVVTLRARKHQQRQLKLDKLLTGKWTGTPIMLLLLAAVFYLTISGSNTPSQWLSAGLFWVEAQLTELFQAMHAPAWLHGAIVLGVYRTLAWVVSVMLPPMAIFFPLFTLLEDLGYLPRVAFNLDHKFRKCGACGKQALTMCMGFGCNAAGVIGCRIIDSPREQLIAILTNNFVPCNGRFPTLIALITMFFIGTSGGGISTVLSAVLLTVLIVLGVGMTFITSQLLHKTVLKGVPSAFTLELPPYRRPQIGKVIVRSVLDRTLFVLGRAAAVAAPMGLLIWVMVNVVIGNATILAHCAGFLDPFARIFGLDGVILMAFLLGLPANEIIVPLIVMAYMSQGSLIELNSLSALKALLLDNGWTWVTAICVMLFSLMHWPCTTTLLTIKKETGSIKWMALAFLLPTVFGLFACALVACAARLWGLL